MAGSITFTPTEQDYVAANRAVMLNSLFSWRGPVVRWTIVFAVIAVIVGYAIGDWGVIRAMATVTALLALVILLANYLLIPAWVRRMLDKRRSLLGEIAFTWDAQGIEARSPSGTSRRAWRDVRRWIGGRHGLVFVMGPKAMLIVPAHALTGERRADLLATARESR